MLQKLAANARGKRLQKASRNKNLGTQRGSNSERKRIQSSSPGVDLHRRKKIVMGIQPGNTAANDDDNDVGGISHLGNPRIPTRKAGKGAPESQAVVKDRRRMRRGSEAGTQKKNPPSMDKTSAPKKAETKRGVDVLRTIRDNINIGSIRKTEN